MMTYKQWIATKKKNTTTLSSGSKDKKMEKSRTQNATLIQESPSIRNIRNSPIRNFRNQKIIHDDNYFLREVGELKEIKSINILTDDMLSKEEYKGLETGNFQSIQQSLDLIPMNKSFENTTPMTNYLPRNQSNFCK